MSSSQEIKFALNRINRVLKGKRTEGYRDIRLGLDRIQRVVPKIQDWKGIHVAGTNGKGSICTFLAGMFKGAGIGYGSFTSPAFPEKHNGVTINGLYVNPRMYEMEMQHVQEKWDRIATGWAKQHGDDPKGLSPFEAETATAFRVFNKMHVPYGIVEVGMGGATDATNVMKHKAVTVISKIGLDHQEYLGNTIENIAKVKAGIMKKGVPCIVDHTNLPSVIHVLREHARSIGTDIILTWKGEPLLMSLDNSKWQLESYQVQNLLCAAMAFRQLFPLQQVNFDKLLATGPFLPGRLETVRVNPPASGTEARDILVDGAHNMLGIETLAEHVNKRLRTPDQPVTWVMGVSASKDKPLLAIIEKLVQPHDNFAMVEFTQGPNDPQPAPANYGTEHARTFLQTPEQVYDGEPDISSALPWAFDKAKGGPVVVTGSLYLIRQLLSLKGIRRTRELGTRRPGRSQLYRYTKLAREGKLTKAERRQFKEARRHFELSPQRSRVFSDRRERGYLRPRKQPVSKVTRSLQREVAFHANQRRSYEQTIKALTKDLRELDRRKKNPNPEGPVAKLVARIGDLKTQVAQHKKKHSETMTQLRGYEAIPHMKYKTHTQIFGYPKKPKAPTQSPFKVDEEAVKSNSKRKGKPVMTWKDRRESFTEEVAAAEKERAMATREAARRTRAAKDSADPFKDEMAGGRRVS